MSDRQDPPAARARPTTERRRPRSQRPGGGWVLEHVRTKGLRTQSDAGWVLGIAAPDPT